MVRCVTFKPSSPAMRPNAMRPPPMRPTAMKPPATSAPAIRPPPMRPPIIQPPVMRPPAMRPPATRPPQRALAPPQSRPPTVSPPEKASFPAPKRPSEPSVLWMACVVWAMVASLTSFLVVYLNILHTKLPSFPAGYVGDWCGDSAPCLGEADCVQGACFCDTLAFRVVAGVCSPVDRASNTPRKTTDEAGASESTEASISDRDNEDAYSKADI